MAKRKTALTVQSSRGVVAFDAAREQARAFRVDARSANTRRAYARWWRDYEAWCEKMGRPSLVQLDGSDVKSRQQFATETIAGYLAYLANGRGSGKPCAKSTVGQALAALQLAMRMAADGRSDVLLVDFKSPRLKEVAQGIRNAIAKVRQVKKAAPLLNEDMRALLDHLDPKKPRDARDAAILAVGWAGARRRSEIAGLDWQKLGNGTGYVTIDEKGIALTLMVGKTHQDQAETIIIPRSAMPTACTKLQEWVAIGKIAPGTPLFRRIRGEQYNRKKEVRGPGMRGVSYHRATGKWQARVIHGGKETHVGVFESPEEAHEAFLAKRQEMEITTAGAGEVLPERFGDGSIGAMIKSRMQEVLRSRKGKKLTEQERATIAARYSGHSMRAGFITAAAERGVPAEMIMTQSGHKSHTQVSGYIRIADKWRKNALVGVGF